MEGSFSRFAIVNRGEAAMRLVHAARELNDVFVKELATTEIFLAPTTLSLLDPLPVSSTVVAPATKSVPVSVTDPDATVEPAAGEWIATKGSPVSAEASSSSTPPCVATARSVESPCGGSPPSMMIDRSNVA